MTCYLSIWVISSYVCGGKYLISGIYFESGKLSEGQTLKPFISPLQFISFLTKYLLKESEVLCPEKLTYERKYIAYSLILKKSLQDLV